MRWKVIMWEMGCGNDWRGGDYTKAAERAVDDARHHSALTMLRTLGVGAQGMYVDVTIGVRKPEEVDRAAIQASLPHGTVTVNVVKGGLDIPDEALGDVAVIASAALVVRLELP